MAPVFVHEQLAGEVPGTEKQRTFDLSLKSAVCLERRLRMDTMRAAEQENLRHSLHEVDNADVGHDVLSFEEERMNLRETGECCILKQCEGSAFGRIEAEALCAHERSSRVWWLGPKVGARAMADSKQSFWWCTAAPLDTDALVTRLTIPGCPCWPRSVRV